MASFIEFCTCDQMAYVKVTGCATMNNSHLFRDLTDTLLERGMTRFIVDLDACRTMDSTFMGVLVGITLYETANGVAPRVLVIHARDLCERQLVGLGLQNLLQIKSEEVQLPQSTALERIEEQAFDTPSRLRMIEQAHKNLIRVNKRNEAIFGPILQSLGAELEASTPQRP